MTTFWIGAARPANCLSVLFILYIFAFCVVSHFGFEGGTVGLISPVSGHCLPLILIWSYETNNCIGNECAG